jgi:hypothetical protein
MFSISISDHTEVKNRYNFITMNKIHNALDLAFLAKRKYITKYKNKTEFYNIIDIKEKIYVNTSFLCSGEEGHVSNQIKLKMILILMLLADKKYLDLSISKFQLTDFDKSLKPYIKKLTKRYKLGSLTYSILFMHDSSEEVLREHVKDVEFVRKNFDMLDLEDLNALLMALCEDGFLNCFSNVIDKYINIARKNKYKFVTLPIEEIKKDIISNFNFDLYKTTKYNELGEFNKACYDLTFM